METDRITSSGYLDADAEVELSLRPRKIVDFIGQDGVKKNLKIYIEAAKKRGEPLDHVLFYGPPGLGKTTLAGIIANEMEGNLHITSGPAIDKAGVLASMLTSLMENDVLFIDEIHRLNRSVEEVLYSAMEDYAIDIVIGKGPSARSLRLDIPQFTLIGATTRAGSLSAPLRDRFGVVSKFELYGNRDLMQIIRRSGSILKIEMDENSVETIARRSRGTPRIANRLLKRVRDFSQVVGDGHIDLEITETTCRALGIDEMGLEERDRDYLRMIIQRFQGGPVGIDTLAAALGEDRVTIEDVYEPYLIQTGLLNRTQHGRMASDLAYKHLGIPKPE